MLRKLIELGCYMKEKKNHPFDMFQFDRDDKNI